MPFFRQVFVVAFKDLRAEMRTKEAINASSDKSIQSFDASLHELYKQGRIGLEEALANADSRANLEAKINFG